MSDDEKFLLSMETRAKKSGPQHYTKTELGKLYTWANRGPQWNEKSGRRQGSYIQSLIEEARDLKGITV